MDFAVWRNKIAYQGTDSFKRSVRGSEWKSVLSTESWVPSSICKAKIYHTWICCATISVYCYPDIPPSRFMYAIFAYRVICMNIYTTYTYTYHTRIYLPMYELNIPEHTSLILEYTDAMSRHSVHDISIHPLTKSEWVIPEYHHDIPGHTVLHVMISFIFNATIHSIICCDIVVHKEINLYLYLNAFLNTFKLFGTSTFTINVISSIATVPVNITKLVKIETHTFYCLSASSSCSLLSNVTRLFVTNNPLALALTLHVTCSTYTPSSPPYQAIFLTLIQYHHKAVLNRNGVIK